jgi:5-methylcytosine-specific restriction endonuclease McrA
MQAVLLLNFSYEPLKVISWQRAVTLFFSGKVEVVEEYDHDIRSVSLVIRAPAVVRLLKFCHQGSRPPPLSRANLLARDNFECQYCAKVLSSKESTVDHVLPRSQGGGTTWENVVCCCAACNRRKGGRTPTEARMALRKTPVKPEWLPVFCLSVNGNLPSRWETFVPRFYAGKRRRAS